MEKLGGVRSFWGPVGGEKEDAQTDGLMDSSESSRLRASECPAQKETISPQRRAGRVRGQDHS